MPQHTWPCPAARCAPLIVVAALLFGGGNASAQSGADNPIYQSAIAEAVTEFSAGRWAEARALFKRAHSLSPNARTLRGMGMCAYELRMYVPALRELLGALQEKRRPLDEAQRIQVNQLVAQASNFIGRFHVTLLPAGTALVVDDKPVKLDPGNLLFLELGEHRIAASAEGYQPMQQRVRVEGMETRELRIELQPVAPVAAAAVAPAAGAQPEQSSSAPAAPGAVDADGAGRSGQVESSSPALAIVGWSLLGAAAVSGVVAGAYWYAGGQQVEKFEEACTARAAVCTRDEYEGLDVPLADTVATIGLVSTVVFGAAGATLLSIDVFSGGGEQAALAGRLAVGPASIQLSGSF